MTPARGCAPAEPFFLPVEGGQRFCLFHPAAGACRGAVLYVHPFAEEMNRSRRMAALQARELAALGFAVLQPDLHGCGDSSGESGDARWETWLGDLAAAGAWLRARTGAPLVLWGLRLGALLALDYARQADRAPAAVLLWQPVQDGRAFINQFLRLRLAGDMLAGADSGGGTAALRASLAAGEVLEVAGYDLHPALVRAIDAAVLGAPLPPAVPLHWFELGQAPDRPLTPAVARTLAAWSAAGLPVHSHQVSGPAFWTTQEITECPGLLAATSGVLRELAHAL
jgi:exosortase A-associated hydrolase 2